MDLDDFLYDNMLTPEVKAFHPDDDMAFCETNFALVGSRSIVPAICTPETDYDYIAVYSDETEKKLRYAGFTKKAIGVEYMDFATMAVWTAPALNAQVTLKRPDMIKAVVKMWQIFRLNPKLYAEYFWKSNPKAPVALDQVRERIEAFLQFTQKLV